MTSVDPGNDLPANDIFASQAGGPTVPRMLLGAQMRKLRQASGISLEAAGLVIHASGSKISRLEQVRMPCGQRDIADLLTPYGIHGEQERAAVPSAKESTAGEDGQFTILRFSEPDLPDVVYLEHLTSAIYLDKRGGQV
jgi:helix-turn-helix protein